MLLVVDLSLQASFRAQEAAQRVSVVPSAAAIHARRRRHHLMRRRGQAGTRWMVHILLPVAELKSRVELSSLTVKNGTRCRGVVVRVCQAALLSLLLGGVAATHVQVWRGWPWQIKAWVLVEWAPVLQLV